MAASSDALKKILERKEIDAASRHVFFCAGPTCVEDETGMPIWQYLKETIKAKGLSSEVMRTKAGCLRVCAGGPVAVVYPDGIWYKLVDKAGIDRIVSEHLVEGRPVEDLIFHRNPLMHKEN